MCCVVHSGLEGQSNQDFLIAVALSEHTMGGAIHHLCPQQSAGQEGWREAMGLILTLAVWRRVMKNRMGVVKV